MRARHNNKHMFHLKVIAIVGHDNLIDLHGANKISKRFYFHFYKIDL